MDYLADLSPKAHLGYAPYSPGPEKQALIDAANQVLTDHQNYGPMPVRQIFYRLTVKGLIPKTEPEYKKFAELMTRARRAEMIDFRKISDMTASITSRLGQHGNEDGVLMHFQAIAEARLIRRDKYQDQEIILFSESQGMVPQIERVADQYSLTVWSNSGSPSVTTRWNLGLASPSLRPVLMLHIGDHDPGGCNIYQSTAEDARVFAQAHGRDFDAVRVAVRPSHIFKYSLPTGLPKLTKDGKISGGHDFRYSDTAEIDAFSPPQLAQLVEDAILKYWDPEAADKADDEDEEVRERILARLED